MLTIGLTGGIGVGKSTVAQYFHELGIAIIDADIIAREVVAPGTAAFTQIITHFGNKALDKNKQLNRAYLRETIFNHTEQREWLEDLLHPLIREQIQQQRLAVQSPYCILVIPLLLEKKAYVDVDRILVIDTETTLQQQRVQQRDQLSVEQVNAIIANQFDRQARLKHADDIIQNNADLNYLKQQVHKLHEQYLQLAISSSTGNISPV